MVHKSKTVSPKKISWFLLILFAVLNYIACEKDDICVDGDTPLLIIRFYDSQDTTVIKEVTNLRVLGIDRTDPISTFADRSSVDSIAIPLQINEPNTSFLLILDSADEDDVETGNIDTLTFNYDTKEVFISRACGFVANYEGLTEALTPGTENWIQNIEIVSSLVQKQDSAHVKIFH